MCGPYRISFTVSSALELGSRFHPEISILFYNTTYSEASGKIRPGVAHVNEFHNKFYLFQQMACNYVSLRLFETWKMVPSVIKLLSQQGRDEVVRINSEPVHVYGWGESPLPSALLRFQLGGKDVTWRGGEKSPFLITFHNTGWREERENGILLNKRTTTVIQTEMECEWLYCCVLNIQKRPKRCESTELDGTLY